MGVNAEVVDQVVDKGRKYIRLLRKIPPLFRFGSGHRRREATGHIAGTG